MKNQAHAASRKWFARALAFLGIRKQFGPNTADQYRYKFNRQDKFAAALYAVTCGLAVAE